MMGMSVCWKGLWTRRLEAHRKMGVSKLSIEVNFGDGLLREMFGDKGHDACVIFFVFF